ncbi:hypothetical protein JCM8547_003840 [Rhodosporidiobolus lusitaniae]
MAAVGRMLKRDPALTPLFVAVGAGVTGALAFGAHYLRHSPDVIVKKKQRPEPWNDVEQHKNTKLHSVNKDFWANRKDVPNPRAMFSSPDEMSEGGSYSDKVVAARDHAVKAAKEKTMAFHTKEEKAAKDSGMH